MKEVKSATLDDYLESIKKNLRFTKRKVKKDVLSEISDHLSDSANEMGGPSDDNFKKAIEKFGDAKTVAQDIKETYGYGLLIKILIFIPVIVLSIFTIPISLLAALNPLYFISPILVFLFIILSSIKAGKWFGFGLALGANITRFVVLGIIFALPLPDHLVEVSGDSVFLIILVGILILLAGYIPGHAVQKYNEGEFLQEYKMMKDL